MTLPRRLLHVFHTFRAGIVRVAAPLAIARGGDSMYWADPDGQRRCRRIPMQREATDLYVQSGGLRSIIPVHMLDLSAGGARISAAGLPAVSPNVEVMLTAPLPGGGFVSGISAHIVWMQHGLAGAIAGLEFIGISAQDRRRIQAAIEAATAAPISA